uniref:Uncharacterized protein n=1 Tax=Knipowitschia caucasica TaxID=637954 RepID=A0AAV2LLL6_KNICA
MVYRHSSWVYILIAWDYSLSPLGFRASVLGPTASSCLKPIPGCRGSVSAYSLRASFWVYSTVPGSQPQSGVYSLSLGLQAQSWGLRLIPGSTGSVLVLQPPSEGLEPQSLFYRLSPGIQPQSWSTASVLWVLTLQSWVHSAILGLKPQSWDLTASALGSSEPQSWVLHALVPSGLRLSPGLPASPQSLVPRASSPGSTDVSPGITASSLVPQPQSGSTAQILDYCLSPGSTASSWIYKASDSWGHSLSPSLSPGSKTSVLGRYNLSPGLYLSPGSRHQFLGPTASILGLKAQSWVYNLSPGSTASVLVQSGVRVMVLGPPTPNPNPQWRSQAAPTPHIAPQEVSGFSTPNLNPWRIQGRPPRLHISPLESQGFLHT